MRRRKYTEPTFWTFKQQRGECWEWTGPRNMYGYGRIRGFFEPLAHRAAWVLAHGSIPESLHVLHRCDNRGCINPDHLFLGTNADNMADRNAKGRTARGERSGRAKLQWVDVVNIRWRSSTEHATHEMLAAEYGVARSTITRIINGRIWTAAK